jgi:hypothetical protein
MSGGVGTQLSNLIDKPLTWYVDVLPYGRSFAHPLVKDSVGFIPALKRGTCSFDFP